MMAVRAAATNLGLRWSAATCLSRPSLLATHTNAASARQWWPKGESISSDVPSLGRWMSASSDSKADTPREGQPAAAEASADKAEAEADEPAKQSVEELQELLSEAQSKSSELETQLKETKDRLIYTLADMENLRQRTARQTDEAKKFAVQGFVKSILEVADNLERAANAVPDEVKDGGEVDGETARKLLLSMLEGVQMTDKILLQIFQQNGVEKIAPLGGEKFDPNMHQALFEMPDPSKEPGTVAVVTKAGYTLHGRVVRSADVGVVKAE